MKIQITKYDFYLKSLWGVHLWSTHQVLSVKKCYRKKKGIRIDVTFYKIKATILYRCNFTGNKTEIWVNDSECKVLN